MLCLLLLSIIKKEKEEKMIKRYFIYWSTNRDIDGNIILSIDWNKISLKEVIKDIIHSLNKEDPKVEIKNISIPFMVEIK